MEEKLYPSLWRLVLEDAQRRKSSIHGLSHWERVWRTGAKLAADAKVDLRIAELFALLHDSRRENDGHDPEHGRRAAKYAATLKPHFGELGNGAYDSLIYALSYHTERRRTGDPAVAVCWDSDRLDLGRVGIVPDPDFMNTELGRKMALVLSGL